MSQAGGGSDEDITWGLSDEEVGELEFDDSVDSDVSEPLRDILTGGNFGTGAELVGHAAEIESIIPEESEGAVIEEAYDNPDISDADATILSGAIELGNVSAWATDNTPGGRLAEWTADTSHETGERVIETVTEFKGGGWLPWWAKLIVPVALLSTFLYALGQVLNIDTGNGGDGNG